GCVGAPVGCHRGHADGRCWGARTCRSVPGPPEQRPDPACLRHRRLLPDLVQPRCRRLERLPGVRAFGVSLVSADGRLRRAIYPAGRVVLVAVHQLLGVSVLGRRAMKQYRALLLGALVGLLLSGVAASIVIMLVPLAWRRSSVAWATGAAVV